MSKFTEEMQDALEMIAENGQSVQWVSKTVEDADKPWLPKGSTTVSRIVNIVFLPYSVQNRQFLQYLLDTNVPTGSLMGLMGNEGFEPLLSDYIVRPNIYSGKEEKISIQSINTLAPDGLPLLTTIAFEK